MQLDAVASLPNPPVDARDSGACATVAYLRGKDLWVAGAGDCSAVLARFQRSGSDNAISDDLEAIRLSVDHKCDEAGEKARILAHGGYVRPAVYEDGESVPRLKPTCCHRPPSCPLLPPARS